MSNKSKKRPDSPAMAKVLESLSSRIKAARKLRGSGKFFQVSTPEIDSWLGLALALERRVAELEAKLLEKKK